LHNIFSPTHLFPADGDRQSRQRSPTPLTNPNAGLFPYPNINPFALPGLAAAAANYQGGFASLAGAAASQQLQNYLFPNSLYGAAAQLPKPPSANLPCFDQVPAGLYPYLSGVPSASNWMTSAAPFANVLPPNHPYLQVHLFSTNPLIWRHDTRHNDT
jgi:hypothetical protein